MMRSNESHMPTPEELAEMEAIKAEIDAERLERLNKPSKKPPAEKSRTPGGRAVRGGRFGRQ